MKITTSLPVLVILIFMLAACSSSAAVPAGDVSASPSTAHTVAEPRLATDTGADSGNASSPISVEYDSEDLDTSGNNAGTATIQLNGDTITLEGDGASIEGSVVTITAAGTYTLRGTLNDGQITVDTQDAETVTLLLDGVNITSLSSAPIFVANAEKVVITLAGGSENVISDGDTYLNLDEDGEPNAAIFSKDDLTINGSGTLSVNASYNNGIASKDDLKITGGTITVKAANDGIKGKDSVAIRDGVIVIDAAADGIQSTNADDPEKGYVAIEGGTSTITAGLDGIQAETSLLVSGGTLDITTGGGSVVSGGGGGWGGRGMGGNLNQTDESNKGLKAGVDLTISGGKIVVSALDDALHSNGSMTINGGDLQLASGDDGAHADTSLTINGGTLDITQSYEGLESMVITINDGTIHLIASDDGINTSSGTGGDMGRGMPGGQGGFGAGDNYLYIHGGTLYVNANGDGIDANSPIEMTGGVVLINGPTNDGNGPVDYTGSFNISGGFLVAVGSAGMAQAPSMDSTQYAVLLTLNGMQRSGTLVHIETAAGEDVLTYLPAKEYQSVLVSSPDLENGESYVVYTGGSSTGTPYDGLISDGEYTPGTQATSFTITDIVTGGGMGGFPGGRGGGKHPRP